MSMLSDSEKDSPSPSDDEKVFQDAADGISHEEEEHDQKDDKHVSSSTSSTVDGKTTEDSSVSVGSTGKTQVSSIASGVAALMARFEGGSGQKSGKDPEKKDKIQGGSKKSQEINEEDLNEGYRTTKQEEPTKSSFGAEEEGADSSEIAPSEGATSLLDHNETIANPFSTPMTPNGDGTVPPSANAAASQSHLYQSSIDLNGSQSKAALNDIQDTPASSHANRFSTVSLSTTQPPSSKRNSVVTPQDSIPSDGQASGSSEFLARNTARLSMHESQRQSINNTEKFKEKLNELRHAHSREPSLPRENHSEANHELTSEDANDRTIQGEEGQVQNQRSSWDGPPVDETEEESIDWDFWGDVMSNYQDIARTQPRKLSRAIQAGIPAALRGMMWQLMSSSKDEEMEIIYAYYIKQTSPHEKMIRKDLSRTFPGQVYFQDGKGIGQENLFNVVKAYSLYDEECGYCQGMQFIVGPLLLNMPDEEAFSTLVRLMKSYDLRGHFVPNMPSLQLRLFQFERLLEECLPLLHRHLVRQGVKSSMYASGWIMTLFTYRSPLSICFRILDSVFAEGIEAIFRFALALMKKNEEQLLSMSFDEAVPLLAARIFDVYKKETVEGDSDDGSCTPSTKQEHHINGGQNMSSNNAQGQDEYRVGEFVRDAFEFKITPFMLDSYASDFAEQVRVATAHRREIEGLKIENRALQIRVKSLEDQLGAVQQEHVDLVKNVVMSKLAKEEMAEELMRYKMMYAEAALLVDQSNASQNHAISPSASSATSLRQSQ